MNEHARLQAIRWCLLWGNFFIGCGVMVVGGALNDISSDLQVSVSAVGHLIAVAAIVIGVGAPILATLVSQIDRRWLLSGALLWYGMGHCLCAICPQYEWLLPIRALTVLAEAVFTPQAAATIGFLTPVESRGKAITFVFFGWAMAAVIGMPLAAWVGERLGWQAAMMMVGLGSMAAALVLYRTLPAGIKPPAASMRAWKTVLSSPVLVGTVLVTALQSAGQMTMVGFGVAYFKTIFDASPEQISLMLAYFGAMSMLGVLVLNRWVDRITPAPAVNITLVMMWMTMLAWPLATNLPLLAVIMLPWALSGFATSSGQQARLIALSPSNAPALMSLNTSAIYLGHAAGASSGSWVIAHHGYGALHWPALAWASLAVAVSVWAYRSHQANPAEMPAANQLV
jgi:predicted MFS family arabinose efflux permease